ncbi:23S rRNA (uracil(1939)-C(5))-methyltransferase RlmD [Rhodothermus bifroesti]|uniref:23S rRNA (uracil(1939)-C(5))-methyltransferase RlmD n=1 Tax=Rhodothermus bifroesti TaxID=2823335 RepID=UPI000CA754E6|nr:23S rRNA (uracil-C(5))-methyltransferase RlmCD [bacterium HR18]
MLHQGDELELRIEKFADRGKSLTRVDGYVLFIESGVPGDRVRVCVTKRKASYAEARIVQLLEPSPLRTAPRCRYFGTCGGCKWQHVHYEAQLEAKRQRVYEALVHHGGFDGVAVRPTLPSPRIYGYRNKMEFSFSTERWLTPEEIASQQPLDRHFAVGLHVPNNFYKVIDLEECHLPEPITVRLLNALRTFFKEQHWEPWDIRRHTGYLRHLVVRTGTRTGEVMVNLITSRYDTVRMAELKAFVQQRFPEVTTLVNTINTSPAQVAYGEATHILFGPGVIHDKIGPFQFEIAPEAFFQTNTEQAERLYEVTRELAEVKPEDLVYDLYCGTGTISIFIAPHVRHVVGVELVASAVENARANAAANHIPNCTFVAGDLLQVLTPEFVRMHGRPDVIIVDPPRGGMHPQVVRRIAQLRPERLVYVSCNPQTQARDLKLLREHYRIEAVQPVDLFPHTDHVECVVALRACQA